MNTKKKSNHQNSQFSTSHRIVPLPKRLKIRHLTDDYIMWTVFFLFLYISVCVCVCRIKFFLLRFFFEEFLVLFLKLRCNSGTFIQIFNVTSLKNKSSSIFRFFFCCLFLFLLLLPNNMSDFLEICLFFKI